MADHDLQLRPVRCALLSVSDKAGIVDFAQKLNALGVKLLSTGGTARTLREAGLPVTDVSDHTGFPEMMEGRVKTLHPTVHGGILAKRGHVEHEKAMETHGIEAIDLVVVNLYPFEETVASQAEPKACIEQIDIGGPAMIRSAAKNHFDVTVVTDPADYDAVTAELNQHNGTTLALRRKLAGKAYSRTARYDTAIAAWFAGRESGSTNLFPEALTLSLERQQMLRYGENPHQQAAWYKWQGEAGGLAGFRQLQGKELSYNNINDTDAAWQLVQEFDHPAVAIIKHANPCGVAVGRTQVEAFQKALACDPTSAFGGIIACNRPLEAATVEAMGKLFVEVMIAPDAEAQAVEALKAKKNLRLLVAENPQATASKAELQVRAVSGGLLVQEADAKGSPAAESLKIASEKQPDAAQVEDLQFAFTVAKHVKSNAIVLAKDGATIGIGAGQMSRVDSVRIAVRKAEDAGLSTTGAALASDAFFPFDDNIHHAAEYGIAALIQPGGSIRDDEVIAAANKHGMVMALTGIRHFRH